MSKRYAHTRSKSKKPLILGIVAVLCVAAMIGGAFAWSDFTQAKTNRFKGTFDADVTLHDEFDGENKHVFAENSGETPIYVRVRLDEFMMVGDTKFSPDADIRDTTTWTTHLYDGESITDCGQAQDGKFHDFYEWTMSGRQRHFYHGVPGMVYTKLGSDGKVNEVDGDDLTAGEAAPVLLSKALEVGAKALAEDTLDEEEAKIWKAIQDGCWILDDTDTAENGGGWAYWSKALQPGEATNLLLDEVKLVGDPANDWVYRIDVKLQAVSLGDTGRWNDDLSECGYKVTEGAQALINYWKA